MYTSCFSRSIDSTSHCHSFPDPLNENYAYHQRHKLDSHYSISTTNLGDKSLVAKQGIDLNNNNNNDEYILRWNNKFRDLSTKMCDKPDDNMSINDIELFNNPLTPLSTQPEYGLMYSDATNATGMMDEVGEEEEEEDTFRRRSQTWGGEKIETMHKSKYRRFNQPNQLSLLTVGLTKPNTTASSSIKESIEGCGSSSIQSIDQLNDYATENDDSAVSSTIGKDQNLKQTPTHKSNRPFSSLVSSSTSTTSLNSKASGNNKKSSRRNPWGQETYAELIESAINSYPNRMATLQQIYEFISFNYAYFGDRNDSTMSAGWKNSIRHNLSLHDKFIKCPKRNDNVKSSLWAINHNSSFRKGRSNSLEKRKDVTPRRKVIKEISKKYYSKSSASDSTQNIKTESSVNMDTDDENNFNCPAENPTQTNSKSEETQDTPVITSSTNPENPLKIKIALKNPTIKKDQPPIKHDIDIHDKWCSEIPGVLDEPTHNFFGGAPSSSQGYTPQTPYKPQVLYSTPPPSLSPAPSMFWPPTTYTESPNSCHTYNPANSTFSLKSQQTAIPTTTTQELTPLQYPHHYSSTYSNNQHYPVPFQNAALEYSKFIADLFIDDFDE